MKFLLEDYMYGYKAIFHFQILIAISLILSLILQTILLSKFPIQN